LIFSFVSKQQGGTGITHHATKTAESYF